jgi:uncharacterized glyoxalase superfamily protein PhnB
LDEEKYTVPSLPLLIPCLRYADAPSAIAFLCKAFGFERHAVHTDSSNPTIVLHAQLNLGDTMVMLGSAAEGEARERYRWRTPAEAGGITMCVCAVVDDIEAHYDRAIAAGADIVTPLHDNAGYPGRSYSARDPEGNVWDFGTYNPWAM